MANYTITPAGDGSGFQIGLVDSDGARHTMLGFTSMAEAEAWIVQDKRLNNGSSEIQEREVPNVLAGEESLA
jgi:hypothetical protein